MRENRHLRGLQLFYVGLGVGQAGGDSAAEENDLRFLALRDLCSACLRLVRRLRAILHHAKTEGLAAQNRNNEPVFEAWLQGMIAYVCMVNPAQGQPLKATFSAIVLSAKTRDGNAKH